MKKFEWWILLIILIGGFVVRLYRFDNPIADWHSWRQADTSAVSRNFVKYGYTLLYPRYDDISNVQTGFDNPNGYRFVEFPVYNIFQAGLYQLFGVFSLEEWGRLVTIAASLSISVSLYAIVKRHLNITAAIFTALFYTFIPFSIYYGRTILPDTSMVACSLAGIYFFDKWIERSSELKDKKSKVQTKNKNVVLAELGIQESEQIRITIWFIVSIIFTAVACLLKPYALFFTLPMIYLAWQRFGFKGLLKWQLWVYLIISVAPLAAWRWWIGHYPEGVPSSLWLFNGNGIRFRPAFFRWIGYDRVTRLISGFFGVPLLIFSVFKTRNFKKYGFFYTFLISSILYICVFATGNVQHDYYQILIIPSLAIFYGLGAYFLFTHSDKPSHVNIWKLLLIVLTVGMVSIGWYYVRDYFNINNPSIISAGHAVDKLTPPDAKVIALYNGDTSFLYQTKRVGWPSLENGDDKLKMLGASYLVIANPTKTDFDGFKKYKVIAQTKEYAIWKL